MYSSQIRTYEKQKKITLSVIVPTYNESESILPLIETIYENMPSFMLAELIIVDDNSPDGTGRLVDEYTTRNAKMKKGYFLKIIHREHKTSLMAAIQISLLYVFVAPYQIQHPISLLIAVAIASIGNFLLNKRWTFGEKIWG